MDIEYFNKRITLAQEKLFDSEVLVTGCVYDLLKELDIYGALITAEVPFLDKSRGGYRSFIVGSVLLEAESGAIIVTDNQGLQVSWDALDLGAKETIMNELFLKYSADAIYDKFSAKDEIH